MRAIPVLSLLLAITLSGCAHTRLSCNTTKQAKTLTEIEEQQVLDNIAMFVVNCGSTPYFALPNGGGTLTNQAATASSTLMWNPRTLTGENGTLSGTAGLTVNWTLKPINEPERLQLMKCVYQHVTQNHSTGVCNTCSKDLTNFFGPDCIAECHFPSGWFSVSNKKPRHKNCCCKVGHYCGTYVCVSEEYFEYLSRVTVAILDIATADSVALASRIADPDDRILEIEETFDLGEGKEKRTIKGKLKISRKDYEDLHDRKIKTFSPSNSRESIRQRRESGSSFESLQQLNLGR